MTDHGKLAALREELREQAHRHATRSLNVPERTRGREMEWELANAVCVIRMLMDGYAGVTLHRDRFFTMIDIPGGLADRIEDILGAGALRRRALAQLERDIADE